MEILISLIIGGLLIEMYVWLDPFSKALVRWAAARLPSGRDEEFQAQWEADLASLPNSIFKLYFVLRDCVLPIADIQQMMFREEFAEIADSVDPFVAHIESNLDELGKRSRSAVAQGQVLRLKLMSSVDQTLAKLEKANDGNAAMALKRCLALKPELVERFDEFDGLLNHNDSVLSDAINSLRDSLGKAVQAQSRIRDRLVDAKPIEESDIAFLDALIEAFDPIHQAIDAFGNAVTRYARVPDSLLPAFGQTCKAFKAALHLVKRDGV